MERTVCFIGHRNVPDTEEIREKIRKTVEPLIKDGAIYFLFGTRSNFNNICHSVVTSLQEKYPDIKRIAYTCRHEYAVMKEEKEKLEESFSRDFNRPIKFNDYDGEYDFPAKYTAGKASYVERNQSMIDNSDFCIFYYQDSYLPPIRESNCIFLPSYQPNSGTALAYKYAVRKKKTIMNLFESE